MPVTIARWGNSIGVRIPADVLRKPGRARAETIAAVSAMIASIKPSALPGAAQLDDAPAGREVW